MAYFDVDIFLRCSCQLPQSDHWHYHMASITSGGVVACDSVRSTFSSPLVSCIGPVVGGGNGLLQKNSKWLPMKVVFIINVNSVCTEKFGTSTMYPSRYCTKRPLLDQYFSVQTSRSVDKKLLVNF